MQISSRFTIAVHLFACVDTFAGKFKLTSDFIAGSVNCNPVVIRKILQQLKAADLITVARGTGGVAPGRPLDQVTLLDVFRAVESLEEGRLFHFHENPNTACPVGRNIHRGLDDKLQAAQSALEQSLAGFTLAEVIHDTQKAIDGKR